MRNLLGSITLGIFQMPTEVGRLTWDRVRQPIPVLPLRSDEPSHEQVKLSLHGVSKTYNRGKATLLALGNISLKVREGDFLCIVGPSGCGKSTLLNLIAGLDQPTSGTIRVNGRNIEGPGVDRIVIFQELGLFPWLNVEQNVGFGMKIQGISKAERRDRTAHYLELVQLSGFARHFVHQLSGGMKQRVAIARALASDPDILLMDEPFCALDAQTRDSLHEELERIWRETRKTIIFVTHNVREAIRLGTSVAVMTFRPGRLKSIFPIDLARPRHMEDPKLAITAGVVLGHLRDEIHKATDAEFSA
jgi:NitT/TauT family transport system ATP-binding protein